MPEARVFRPRSENENKLIDKLMEVHVMEGEIERPSWTQYVAFLINKDLQVVRENHRVRMGGN